MQEWLNAIFTTEWLLGAAMGFAGKRLITWVGDVVEGVRGVQADQQSDVTEQARDDGLNRPR